ncbi:ngoBIM [Symbiodinium sp. CCMP2592]|nr:ngoBIM [Symbiodinium sp. CCMP2592]
MIPGTLRQWLDGWGSGFQSATDASIGATHARFGLGAAKLPQRLLVGTDCSGIDAPIHGLRELGIPHQHLFGSEVAAGPRSVIEANTKPSVLFHSVLDADKAQIFYGVVARIQLVRPSCFVLENVSGIKRVSAKVLAALRSTGYHVEMILMNPAELQEPIQRPRYYFIGVRQDVSLISPKDMSCWLREAWAEVQDSVASGDAVDLLDRLLPASHPAVAQYQESRKRKWSQASNRGFPGSQAPGSHAPKWKELHKMCKASMQQGSRLKSESRRPCTESGVACCADTLFLHLPRERDAWDIICTKHAGSQELVADVSQNVNRARVRTDGSLPTVTPGAVLVSARAGRIISPLEKVMLHGFPIHRMVFPSRVTDKELASMGGNTMHVQIVAVAMKFALALVNWSLPKASRPTALCSTVAAPSITASVVLGAAAKCRKRHGKPRKAPKAPKAASAQKAPKAPKAPKALKAQKAEGMSALAKRWQKVVRPQSAKKCSRKGATAPLACRLAHRWAK